MYQYMYIYWCNYTDLQHLIPMFLNNLNSLIRKFCIISDFIHINSHQYDWICQMWRNRNSWPTAGKPHKLTAIWSRHSTRTNGIATTERQPPFLHQQRVISSSWATMPWKRKHSWRVSQVTEKTMNNSFSLSCPWTDSSHPPPRCSPWHSSSHHSAAWCSPEGWATDLNLEKWDGNGSWTTSGHGLLCYYMA